jgi:O-antigen/teichoic acid export membrane protein
LTRPERRSPYQHKRDVIFSKANAGTFSTSLLIQACGVVTGVLTARLLGPVARGELATVILWPTILSNLGLMGCNWVLARKVAAEPERESDWVFTGVAVGLATSSLYFLAGYFLIPHLLPADKTYLVHIARLCLWLIPLDICNQILLAVEHGRMRWRRFNVLRLSFFLFYLVLICFAGVTRRAQVRWFVLAFLASHVLTVLTRLWIQRGSFGRSRVRAREFGHLLRAGVPYFGATVSNLVSLQLDIILVVSLFSTEAAGIYAVASALADGQTALGEALGITAFGVLSNEGNDGNRKKIITETFRQSALISSGAGAALACMIPFLVVPFFGARFEQAVRPAVILALAGSVAASASILNQALRGVGRPHAGLVSQLLSAAVLALTALLLFRPLGLVGVALAVCVSAITQLLVLIAAAAKWLAISPSGFWPFGTENIKILFQQLVDLRLKHLRLPA